MGISCIFNLSVDEIRTGLIRAQYFVFYPAVESAGESDKQHFYTHVKSDSLTNEQLKKNLAQDLNLQFINEPNLGDSHYQLSSQSEIRIYESNNKNFLIIKIYPKNCPFAVTHEFIQDVLRVDAFLIKIGLQVVIGEKFQDIIYGENHLLKANLDRIPVQLGALPKPMQDQWIVGRTAEEVQAKLNNTLSSKSPKSTPSQSLVLRFVTDRIVRPLFERFILKK